MRSRLLKSLRIAVTAVSLLVCVFLIALVAVLMNVAPAAAQRGEAVAAPATTAPRFQVSAYGMGTGNGGSTYHGCYVVDTTTGAVCHYEEGGAAQKVVEKLQ